MKKSSLMGASVVAAALLAAAPVVAPVASLATPGTQVVKADNASPAAVSAINDLSKAATGYVVKPSELSTIYGASGALTEANVASALKKNQTTTGIGVGKDNVIVGDDTNATIDDNLFSYFFGKKTKLSLSSGSNLADLDYKVAMHFKGNDGSETDVDTQNAGSVVNTMSSRGGTLTMSLKFYYHDTNTPVTGSNVDVTSSIVDNNHVNNGASFINYKNNLTAQVGDNVNAYMMPSSLTNNGDMINAAGNGILKAAFDQGAVTMGPVVSDYPTGNDKVTGTFTRKGTFYQAVTIDLTKLNFGVPVENLGQALENGLITVNGSSTVSTTNPAADAYYQYTPAQAGTPSVHARVTATPAVANLVLKRTINVTDANSPYKSEKVHGVVTVHKNDGMAAQVYDEKGNAVYERLLPNGSDWRTDEKRTFYKDGKEYYQVSTSEYVRAEDVSYAPRNDNDTPSNNSNSVIKGNVVVTKFPQNVVKLDSACWVWAIDNDNGGMHVVFDRVLPENSVWQCSAKATVNNKTFYQVSSNEWISASYSRLTK
ncbi:hypothetical protein GYU96_03635 [Lactobacillus mellis]|uniref:SLAP domain-containing protein n=1 Tax=Bombilactobacillus mellis TaxID=1218508 RepID=UPI001580A7AD|nr:SLAP domain-containing protein [Bombilactobacillus mellis]NUG66945.1 hypothetical protein [Bombilactobacillus mellis]